MAFEHGGGGTCKWLGSRKKILCHQITRGRVGRGKGQTQMAMPLRYRPLDASESNRSSSGAELVTVDGRSLPLVGARLSAEAGGGLARCVLEQRFENGFDETLRVRYRMPLPADGAVSGYEFEVGGRVIAGRVQPKAQAREQFEQALAAGQTAALLEQDRDDIFTQELGNILPGEAIVARITVDQRLVWLAGASRLGDGPFEGEWELRFPTVIGPRYIGAADTEDDARETHVAVAPGQIGARISIELAIRDAIVGGRAPSSPSHELRTGGWAPPDRLRIGGRRVALRARKGAPLDRDIVVRWPVAAPEVGASLETARGAGGDAYGLVTIVPPAPSAREAQAAPLPRDLTILLDTSGSMGGAPLDAAKGVVALAIGALGERDRLELIEFSDRPRRYRGEPVAATERAKREAIAWVESRQASGGTEMASGVREALRALRPGAQRQVVVVTDGYVGGERQIVELLHGELPRGCRLHVLGVGSAVNRSLASALARAGRGVEVIAGLGADAAGAGAGDDLERAAARLIAHTRAPVLVDVELSGSALIAQAPARVPDVFAGAPVVAAVQLRPEGGELIVRGALAQGAWERRIAVPATRSGEGSGAIAKLYARERVADLEARGAVGGHGVYRGRAGYGGWGGEGGEGEGGDGEGEIEALGVRFQIATRLTSWVAIDERRRAAGAPDRTEEVPQELPHGTSAASFGLRGGAAGFDQLEQMGSYSLDPAAFVVPEPMQTIRGPAKTVMGAAAAPPTRDLKPLKQRLGLKKGGAAAPLAGKPAGPAYPIPSQSDAPQAAEKAAGPGYASAPPQQSPSVFFGGDSGMAEPAVLVARKSGAPLRRWLLLVLLLALIGALAWWLVL
jgi:Ca-activated chloride channel family protein